MAPTHRNRWVKVSAALYGWIVRAYPREFRKEFGAQMRETFADRARVEHQMHGVLGLIGLWANTLTDSASSLFREHHDKRSVSMSEIQASGKVWYRREILKQHSNFAAFWAGVSVCAQLAIALWFLHLNPDEPAFYFWFSVTMLALIPVQIISLYKRFSLRERAVHA